MPADTLLPIHDAAGTYSRGAKHAAPLLKSPASGAATESEKSNGKAASRGWEHWANLAFAISALVASVMRIVDAAPATWWMPPVLGIAGINGLIGVLFLVRRPVVAVGTPVQMASCLPTMVGFGLALRFSPALGLWPWYSQACFAAGAAVTLAAFLSLGSSFGVLPAFRSVVCGGPYRFVRHPAYAGELLMAFACFAAGPSLQAFAPWLLLLPGVIWRIRAEEAVLGADAAYREFARRVRWKLIPGLW